MSDIAILVENISKRYYIDLGNLSRDMIRGRISDMFAYRRKKIIKQALWALKGVSFKIERGETVGIIGRNGAGKSTLLKILSRIIEPTEGGAVIYGRATSLLEIGTGFHEELTGRENIYFNGTILGMKVKEINHRFDKIVAFSGIGEFLDTPLKFYSSGMYLRLAFAVAAYLQSEIILLDEILAVGDTEFQSKCFGRLKEIVNQGKTVVVVSHNMAVINTFCNKAIFLEKGRLIAYGNKEDVVNQYLNSIHKLVSVELSLRSDRKGTGRMRFLKYWLENEQGKRITVFRSGENAVICVEYSSNGKGKLENVSVAFSLKDYLENQITDFANRIVSEIWNEIPSSGIIRCKIPRLPLMPGTYRFNVFAETNGIVADHILDAGKFEVEAGEFFKTGKLLDAKQGNILIDNSWSVS